MKKLLILFVTVVGISLCDAQTVTIPDANFKAALLNHSPVIDTNNDGEIQVSEALNTTTMFVTNFSSIITNTTGLNAFTNLTELRISYTGINTIDVSNLVQLQYLNVSDNNLTSLSVTGLTNLETLICEHNNLFSIDVSGLTNLVLLDFSSNYLLNNFVQTGLPNLTNLIGNETGLQNINLNGLNNLTNLSVSNCDINNLDVTNLTNLITLNCTGNSITSLSLENLTNLNYLYCSGNQLSDLNVSNLVHLNQLFCSSNQLSSLNVTNLSELTALDCSNNQITTLNTQTLSQLNSLSCSFNQLSSLNLSSLVNLEYLDCSANLQLNLIDISTLVNLKRLICFNNNMATLDVTNLVQLTTLHCNLNQITSLDLTNNVNLIDIKVAGNLLTSLDLTHNVNLENIDVSYNLLTNLDLSQLSIVNAVPQHYYVDVSFNSNLTGLNLKNGILFGSFIEAVNCPNLRYICADEYNIAFILQYLNGSTSGSSTTIIENIQVNSYCNFALGGVNNTINGQLTLDINNNGCDAADYNPLNIKVIINDGTDSGATFTNASGNYFFYNQTGNFTITPQFENPYFTVSPTSATLNFPNLDGSTQTQNFCITPNGIHNDVDITIIPSIPPRPGFDSFYQLVYKNKGNQVLSGVINFTFDDAVQDFVSSTPNITTQSTNNLSWNYSNLLPFETRIIDLVLNVNGPMETPPVNIDDILYFTSSISPFSGDATAEDNTFNFNQTVVGSYDPNDKTCLEGTSIPTTKVGDYLHYLIRFQNSGTAPAENIVVKDMIDTTKFDLASLQLTSTSHPQVTRITGNKVEFIFENIQLPAEQDDEPGSHGYVAFKIRTKNNLVLGNTVSNTANIYFDYNFPIVTNTATTTVAALGNNEFENTSVSFSPNPVKSNLTITSNDTITSVQVFDVQGRLIATQLNNNSSATLDMSMQNSGVYFVKVITENAVKVEKIMKE